MISSSRRWLRRNRTRFAVGAGVVGVTYIAGQYVVSKISEYREKAVSDHAAKENLRRRFVQNQEDCNITVLALLPTATEGIIEALPVESLTHELQQKKAERLGRNTESSGAPAGTSIGSPSENTSVAEEEARSSTGDSYVHASQMESSSAGAGTEEGGKKLQKTKAQLWNELKISSIIRTLTLLYTLSLLNLFTRIQLNLLGRRTYISSLIASSRSPPSPTIALENNDDFDDPNSLNEKSFVATAAPDFDTNRKYLTFSWWLLHMGWREILREVEAAVVEVFGGVNPREDVSVERMSGLILEVRRRIEGRTVEERRARKWLEYMLPPEGGEAALLEESGMTGTSSPRPPRPSPLPPSTTEANPTDLPSPPASPTSAPTNTSIPPLLSHLLLMTRDLIDSPPFHLSLTHSLDATFSHLTDTILRTQAYKLPPLNTPSLPSNPSSYSQPTPQVVPAELTVNASTKLATILAVITRQAHGIGSGNEANEYMRVLGAVGQIDSFAGVIYAGIQDIDSSSPVGSLATAAINAAEQEKEEEKRSKGGGEAEESDERGWMGRGEGLLGEVSRQTNNVVGTAEYVVDSTVGMFSGVWSRVVGERGPGLS